MAVKRLSNASQILVSGSESLDAQTIDLVKMQGPGLIKHITIATRGALGASLGFDIIDGGTGGTGTDVIQASTDNLNGEEEFAGVDYDLEDGAVLRATADNYSAAVVIAWAILIEVYGF